MAIEITKKVLTDVTTLRVEAGVRYWEDSEINGVEDTEDGKNIPCKEGQLWKPVIDLETGRIKNWEIGKTADIHYKVCDAGRYYLDDAEGNVIASIVDDYVPSILCPEANGYGDYIIMTISEDGFIQGWKPKLNDFIEE